MLILRMCAVMCAECIFCRSAMFSSTIISADLSGCCWVVGIVHAENAVSVLSIHKILLSDRVYLSDGMTGHVFKFECFNFRLSYLYLMTGYRQLVNTYFTRSMNMC